MSLIPCAATLHSYLSQLWILGAGGLSTALVLPSPGRYRRAIAFGNDIRILICVEKAGDYLVLFLETFVEKRIHGLHFDILH